MTLGQVSDICRNRIGRYRFLLLRTRLHKEGVRQITFPGTVGYLIHNPNYYRQLIWFKTQFKIAATGTKTSVLIGNSGIYSQHGEKRLSILLVNPFLPHSFVVRLLILFQPKILH